MEVKRYGLGGWKVEEGEDFVAIGCGNTFTLTLFAFLRFLIVSVLIFLLIKFGLDVFSSDVGSQKYFFMILLLFAAAISLKLLRIIFLVQRTVVRPKLHQVQQIYLSGLHKRVFEYQSLLVHAEAERGIRIKRGFELYRILTEKGYEVFSFADKSDSMRFMEVLRSLEGSSQI